MKKIISFIIFILIITCLGILIYLKQIKNANIDVIIENAGAIEDKISETQEKIIIELTNVELNETKEETDDSTVKDKDTIEEAAFIKSNNKTEEQTENKKILNNAPKVEKTETKYTQPIIENKKEETTVKKTESNIEEPIVSPESEEAIEKDIDEDVTIKCSDLKHGISVGNTNKWFISKEQAIAEYDKEINLWGDKWVNDEIDDDTYYKNCPDGYEIWSCPYCGKWTLNYYY